MRISDWSSDVCSSDLAGEPALGGQPLVEPGRDRGAVGQQLAKGGGRDQVAQAVAGGAVAQARASGHDRPGADDVARPVVGEALLAAAVVHLVGVDQALEDDKHVRRVLASLDQGGGGGIEADVYASLQLAAPRVIEQLEGQEAEIPAGQG